jgi:hypothetical protein
MKIYIDEHYYYQEYRHLLPEKTEYIWIRHDSPLSMFEDSSDIRVISTYKTNMNNPNVPDYLRVLYEEKELYHYFQYDNLYDFLLEHSDMEICLVDDKYPFVHVCGG